MDMNEIALSLATYEGATDLLCNAVASLTSATDDVPAIASQAITLQEYKTRLDEVGELIQAYRTLLEKDHRALNNVRISLLSVDNRMAGH